MSRPSASAPDAERVQYYLDRAEETRILAEMMKDETAKLSLIQQSLGWKHMADQATKNKRGGQH